MAKEPVVIAKLYDLILWTIPHLDKFPRNHKFTIGDRIETNLLDILELLIERVALLKAKRKQGADGAGVLRRPSPHCLRPSGFKQCYTYELLRVLCAFVFKLLLL